MFSLNGDFGKAIFTGGASGNGEMSSRYMSLDTKAALNFFRRISLVKSDLTKNALGLFSFQQAGRNNEINFASFSTPSNLLQSRKNGCAWNPKGHVDMNISSVSLCPIEYNGEQCPDVFWGDCLEKIFGTGNQVRDFFATPEGTTIFGELVSQIYLGLGNSFYDLAWYGQHPLITDADTNGWYTSNDRDWADYIDQQEACGGFMTIVDNLKAQGETNYGVPILATEISSDGTTFIGTATDVFDRVIEAQPYTMKMAAKRSTGRQDLKGVLLVHPKIFNKYKKELQAEWKQIPEMFHFYYSGEFCEKMGCSEKGSVPGVLMYDGYKVVCMDEWENFDTQTGTITYRVMMVTPGVFGMGYDVPQLNQFGGLGMRMVQHLDAPWQGKIYMDTTFKLGMTIIDKDYVVNASKTLTP